MTDANEQIPPGFTRPPSRRDLARAAVRQRPRRPTLGLVPAVRRALRLGLTFRGRAARDEFWLCVFAFLLIYVALIFLKTVIAGPDVIGVVQPGGGRPAGIGVGYDYNAGIAGTLLSLATVLPMLALGWRRLHDRNMRGWWLLASPALTILIVIVSALSVFGFSAIWQALRTGGHLEAAAPPWLGPAMFASFAVTVFLIIQLARRGTAGPNRFGPDPLEVTQ